jgi:cellulose synthase/poly-beta-1,6-N-acetylglucosamine synthase-like glycosyltransferase
LRLLAGLAVAACIAWLYLLVARGRFWLISERLPAVPDPNEWPAVVAVIPARNEADVLPRTLPTVLTQAYPGRFDVVVVDDESTDGTAGVATATGVATAAATARMDRLVVVRGAPTPAG